MIAIVPKVMIKDGTFMNATPIPFIKPQKRPARSVKEITIIEESESTNIPPKAQEKAAIDPTDKSISPRIITIVIPNAIMPKTITVLIMFWILLKSKKAGLIKIAQEHNIKNKIKRFPLLPNLSSLLIIIIRKSKKTFPLFLRGK